MSQPTSTPSKPVPTHSIRHNGTHIIYAFSASDAFGKLQKRQPASCDQAIKEHGWEVVNLETQERLTADQLYASTYTPLDYNYSWNRPLGDVG